MLKRAIDMSLANNTDQDHKIDDIVIGIGFTTLSLITLVPYIPCLIVIKTDQELKKHSCFKVSWGKNMLYL